jgi:23S rRNA G2445 N2-methylase RlmL
MQTGSQINIFAVANRGLEQIGSEEMNRLPGLLVTEVSYRRITAVYTGDLARLTGLKTVDDVFIDLAAWHDIGPQRSSLNTLKEQSKRLNIEPAIASISSLRSISAAPSFSVTANFVGKRNYTTDEIKLAVAQGITARQDWEYTTEDLSQVNIRVFLEHTRAYVGIRISEKALHRRLYKVAHIPGSLKPSVAAALLQLAEIKPGQRVLDPCCGAGTILVEAGLSGSQAFGGDIDGHALLSARTNAASAGVKLPLHIWDARHLPVAGRSVERIVTNLPWGQQVNVEENFTSFYKSICTEISRVVNMDGQVVVLTNLPHLVQFDRLMKVTQLEISLFGMTPTVMKFSS